MTVGEVAAAVRGALHEGDPGVPVTGAVEYDSRKVAAGGLFVAFEGSTVDGHGFASAAMAAGAVAVLGTKPIPAVPTIVVTDARAAMGELARAVADRLPELTTIGITGSSGKTTTKDLIAQLLAVVGPTVAPAGSLNNELGYPYTVLQADRSTRFLVLEMGARGIGHLRYLCGLVRPDIGVVINVGVAHIGEFGSVETISTAKGELVEALPPTGLAVLNADDPRVAAMAARTSARVLLVGESPRAQVRAVDVTVDERGRAGYRLVTPQGEAPVQLGIAGRHQVGNSLAAAAVALDAGLRPVDTLAGALGDLRLVSSRRMDVYDRPDGVTVIDDSYNANPSSVAAALNALAALGRGGAGSERLDNLSARPLRGRRTVAVLGYLAELGDYEQTGHEEVGRLAAELAVDRLVVVGDVAAPIHHGAVAVATWGGESVLVTDQQAAIAVLRGELRAGDVILVKGSRYRTWDVADFLREADSLREADA